MDFKRENWNWFMFFSLSFAHTVAQFVFFFITISSVCSLYLQFSKRSADSFSCEHHVRLFSSNTSTSLAQFLIFLLFLLYAFKKNVNSRVQGYRFVVCSLLCLCCVNEEVAIYMCALFVCDSCCCHFFAFFVLEDTSLYRSTTSAPQNL